ncbi:PREDICTED: uncharacterized protein LOC104811209 [Tarenaya hassleriana]|uniref:uncharacterized protein LOC104811209 n=1 Tax=Tarenaya hassleriana TaxID=28532 RepID=UPI00053C3C3F|nr:PREDICTED: uncharacterized protein LOC104811209 [Tarenaya hassleriana]
MSPSSKSRSKDMKAVNDLKKTPMEGSGSMSTETGILSGAYNDLLGTFQSIETFPTTGSSFLHNSGRFRNIDESDSTGVDCDSVSNNGSWSGDSEDHKEKASNPPIQKETIPGADNDKREKIRLKNERKHQRQKEKRAQELHERCRQYLMSRKLEVLSQQLVAMGISQERATLALMLNVGKIEESINWLFDQDGGTKHAEQKTESAPRNLNIDISEELDRILELETRYRCTKQEVERAVVAAEGDIEKAEETLRRQKQEQSTCNKKPEETSDNPASSSDKLTTHPASQNTVSQLPLRAGLYPAGQETRERKDFEYLRRSSLFAGGVPESVNQSSDHPLDIIQMKLEWMKFQAAVMGEKNWSSPMSYHQPSAAAPKPEAHYMALGNQFKKLQQQDVREPVMAMQQHSRFVADTNPIPVLAMSSSFPGTANGWYPLSRTEVPQSNGFVPDITATRSLIPMDLSSNPTYPQLQYQGQMNGHRSGAMATTAPAVAAAASLGLFSGFGPAPTSGSSHSSLDWNTGDSMGQLDYTNIDWSLDKSPSFPRPDRQFPSSRTSAYNHNTDRYIDRPWNRMRSDGWNGMGIVGMQEVGIGSGGEIQRGKNARDWTSPFEGKDLFSLSRQFVSSPSL